MKYHKLDKEMRPRPGGMDWWLFCTDENCNHEVHFGDCPFASTQKTYEIAHNLQLLMEATQ